MELPSAVTRVNDIIERRERDDPSTWKDEDLEFTPEEEDLIEERYREVRSVRAHERGQTVSDNTDDDNNDYNDEAEENSVEEKPGRK